MPVQAPGNLLVGHRAKQLVLGWRPPSESGGMVRNVEASAPSLHGMERPPDSTGDFPIGRRAQETLLRRTPRRMRCTARDVQTTPLVGDRT